LKAPPALAILWRPEFYGRPMKSTRTTAFEREELPESGCGIASLNAKFYTTGPYTTL
jgi:hypothetical protein